MNFVGRLFLLLMLPGTVLMAEEKHWSLRPVKRVAVPAKNNPIEYFIGRKLREQKLNLHLRQNDLPCCGAQPWI